METEKGTDPSLISNSHKIPPIGSMAIKSIIVIICFLLANVFIFTHL